MNGDMKKFIALCNNESVSLIKRKIQDLIERNQVIAMRAELEAKKANGNKWVIFWAGILAIINLSTNDYLASIQCGLLIVIIVGVMIYGFWLKSSDAQVIKAISYLNDLEQQIKSENSEN